MSNENNNQFNNEARENHDGQFGHGQKRPYNRPKNYKYKPQHRNSYGRKPMQDRKAPADKEKNGIQVPFKAAIKNSSRRPKRPTSKLKIIPLGGLEQIGMNITAFEYEDSIVVVDCGLAFPEDDMLGIDLVIPDVTYLKENISKVKGFVITHGHEDHIGALPYVLKDVNVPVYSTKLTIALIANKLKEHNMTNTTKLKEVRHGQVINLGDFSNAGLIIMMVLMFIGASPGSTAGGIKTTTIFVLFQGVKSSAINKSEKAFKYAVPKNAFKKAAVITVIGITVVLTGTFLMSLFEPNLEIKDIVFEIVSAYGTVGDSTGITPSISTASKILSMLVMFIGRLGPMTIVTLWYFSHGERVRYPEGNISIG